MLGGGIRVHCTFLRQHHADLRPHQPETLHRANDSTQYRLDRPDVINQVEKGRLKMQEWKIREQTAVVANAGVSPMDNQSENKLIRAFDWYQNH